MVGHRTGAGGDSEGVLSVPDWPAGIDGGLMVRLSFSFVCAAWMFRMWRVSRFDTFKRTEHRFPQPRALKKEVCDANFVQTVYCFLTCLLLRQGLIKFDCLGSIECRRLFVATAGGRQAVAIHARLEMLGQSRLRAVLNGISIIAKSGWICAGISDNGLPCSSGGKDII
jgi:hypothetical protein